jgi:sugar-specific transcriptional regulator TrmB
MIIRDNEEILFFIKPKDMEERRDDLCLWTNCVDLVQAFKGVFEDVWKNSTDLGTKIQEIETGTQITAKTYIIDDADAASKNFHEILQSAQKEVIMITSPSGLIELSKDEKLLNHWVSNDVSVKIMVPVTTENLKLVQKLSRQFDVDTFQSII